MALKFSFHLCNVSPGDRWVPARGTILNTRPLWHQRRDFLCVSEDRKKQNHFLWERWRRCQLSNELQRRSYWDSNRIQVCFVKFYYTWPFAWNLSPAGKHRVMPFSTMRSRYRVHVHNYVTSCIKCACVPSSLTVQLSQRNIDERPRLHCALQRQQILFGFKKKKSHNVRKELKAKSSAAAGCEGNDRRSRRHL